MLLILTTTGSELMADDSNSELQIQAPSPYINYPFSDYGSAMAQIVLNVRHKHDYGLSEDDIAILTNFDRDTNIFKAISPVFEKMSDAFFAGNYSEVGRLVRDAYRVEEESLNPRYRELHLSLSPDGQKTIQKIIDELTDASGSGATIFIGTSLNDIRDGAP